MSSILTWLGLPFEPLGRSRVTGFDCLGICIAYVREVGKLDMPDCAAISPQEIPSQYYDAFEPLPLAGPFRPFDLLVVRGLYAKERIRTRHVGVVTRGPFSVLTTSDITGSVCVPLSVFTAQSPLVEAWRCTRQK